MLTNFKILLSIFTGEIGGYMGLLMGCSCLTICEVLDLVLYNLVLRKIEHHMETAPTKPDQAAVGQKTEHVHPQLYTYNNTAYSNNDNYNRPSS